MELLGYQDLTGNSYKFPHVYVRTIPGNETRRMAIFPLAYPGWYSWFYQTCGDKTIANDPHQHLQAFK